MEALRKQERENYAELAKLPWPQRLGWLNRAHDVVCFLLGIIGVSSFLFPPPTAESFGVSVQIIRLRGGPGRP